MADDGEYQFTDTGDTLIDKWEEQLRNGDIPDLSESFTPESLQSVAKRLQAVQDRDPYQGLSMKSMFDKISEDARAEGLHVGGKPRLTRTQVEEMFSSPTFVKPDRS